MKTTKRSMLVSGLCLLLTAVMLLGSTFAWFTDSVTNEGNVITAGKLSIDAYAYDVGEGGTAVTIEGVNGDEKFTFEEKGQDLKDTTNPTAIINGEINWEPGKSNAKLLTVTNSGSLAANIRLSFDVTDGGLQDALWFDFVRVDEKGNVQGQFEKRPMSTLNQLAQSMVMTLKPDDTLRFVLVYGMYESADNQFQAKTFSADVTIMATQAAVEEDGFGNPNYDAAADGTPDQDWALGGTTVVTKPTTGWAEKTTLAVPGVTAVVPNTAIAEDADSLQLQVLESTDGDIQPEEYQAARYFDISVDGLAAGNDEKVAVSLELEKNMASVQVYHNGVAMDPADYSYDAATGVLTIYTASFSPFTVVCNVATPVSNEAELQAAVAQGGNIYVTQNLVLSQAMTVAEGTTVDLNTNGKTITVTSDFSARPFTNYGTLTIRGGGTVDVTAAGANGYGTVNNYGTLTVVGGTYRNLKESNASNFYNRNGGTATFIDATIYGGGGCIGTEVNTTTEIHGGYYENSTYPAIENRGNMLITAGEFVNTSCSSCDGSKWGYTIRSGESSDTAYLKIQGEAEDSVKVTGVQGGLAVIGGTADIYNGVYETKACEVHTSGASAYYAGYFTGESYETATTIYGGTFRSVSKTAVLVGNDNPAPDSGAGEESTLIVMGGTFIGGDSAKTAITVEDTQYAIGAAKIYAGSFSSNPQAFLANGYVATPDGDMWVVTAE